MFLNKRVEGKLMATVEKKEFKTRDILLLVVFIAIMISVIAYTSIINPGGIIQNILLVLFLSSYTMLLFTFSYVFSNLTKSPSAADLSWLWHSKLSCWFSQFLAPLTEPTQFIGQQHSLLCAHSVLAQLSMNRKRLRTS